MPPTPQSNVEKYLHAIAGHGGVIPSEPLSRVEYYLDEIVKGGGIGGKLRPEIVAALPATGETGLLYLVPSQGSGRNLCDEYFWIEDELRFELLGQTNVEVDLSGYVPNSREVGGKSLTNDIGIMISGTGTIEVADNGTSSTIAFDISHKDSGVTAGSKGDNTSQTPGFGDTFKALSETVDAKGHVTTLTEHTVKIPDTKVTTSTDGLMSKEDKAKLDQYTSKGNATKGIYIDANGSPQLMTHELNADVPANFAPATAAPLMDGTAAVGASAKYAREDHVHPTDTSRASATDVTAQGNRITALEDENALLRELLQGVDAPIYRTASGNPATFDDGYPANVRNLVVTLTPTQSGSGDPSPDNIRPISGATSVSVTRTGKNRCPLEVVTTTTNGLTFTVDQNAGTVTVNGTASAQTVFYLNAFSDRYAGNQWILTGCPSDGNDAVFALRVYQGGNGYATETGSGSAMTGTENLRLGILVRNGVTMSNKVFYPMIRLASETDATFAPYRGQSVRVSLVDSNSDPLTVYGGRLNVTTGGLSVTHVKKTLSSAMAIASYHTNGVYIADFIGYFATRLPGICTHSTIQTQYPLASLPGQYMWLGVGSAVLYWIGILDALGLSSVADFKSWLDTQNVEIVYPLASPVTYQLTAAQLATLSGYNAVSADTGTLSVTYRADTALSLGGVT